MVQRDPEQEVRGIAIPVLDACLSAVREVAGEDPVVAAMRDVISLDALTDPDDVVRAVDALLVVGQLIAAIGRPPRAVFL